MELKHLNFRQITTLLRKDLLIRLRQPWMTLLQFIWPCAIFLSLYILRLRFQAHHIEACQFPTRELPSNNLLPFFQSYICAIDNKCSDVTKYEEITSYEEAPVTPIVNIIQTFLNEPDLYNAFIELPISKEFMPFITKIATNSKFSYIESNADKFVRRLPEVRETIGDNYDIKNLFTNDLMFSNLGKILCHKPFPRSNSIRFVTNVLYSPDYNGPDKDELEVMPTPYCKQLYMDITNNNFGKITWKLLKPIIQGKILYGPENDEVKEIISQSNNTFEDMNKLRNFAGAFATSIKLLKTDKAFRANLDGLLNLAKQPFVQALLGKAIDTESIEKVLESIINDAKVLESIEIIGNILECFSVDRFVAVKSEKELENVAYELAKKKMFYAAVYFTNHGTDNETSYKLRVETDNTPVTIENKNRFWFPGPEGSFELEMRYHRGFISIQNSVDMGIIKYNKHRYLRKEKNAGNLADQDANDLLSFNDLNDTDISTELSDEDLFPSNVQPSTEVPPGINFGSIFKSFQEKINISQKEIDKFEDDSDWWNFDDDPEETTTEKKSSTNLNTGEHTEYDTHLNRTKRQLESVLASMGLNQNNEKKEEKIEVDRINFYTKQFPYPAYTRDDFKKGLYLAQSIQLSFFIALIVQIASAVRNKIWFKESGNFMLMRTMGMRESSEQVSWIASSFIELSIVFLLITVILYSGGILVFSSRILVYFFLIIFGICVISFCFMSSTFFSTASIGSVTTVILFLITFLPYIIIVSLGAVLSLGGKFIASLSFSTAFCYAFHHILRSELQEQPLTFLNAFSGDFANNDFKFGVLMIVLDTFIYAAFGYYVQKFMKDESKFYEVSRKNIGSELGAQIIKVTKIYDDPNKPAVENVSINLEKNKVLCLMGRNGAGKSTVIKLLTGQILPSFGEVNLPLDYDLITGFQNPQEQIGLCSQNNVLIPNLTAEEHLQLYAKIKMAGSASRSSQEIRRILQNMKLGKYKNYKVSELSGGYKRRLCIAIAFLGGPNLVILDEPCSGVDIHARKLIWELIESLRKNRAVLVTTHDLDEAQHLGDNIIIMKDGHIAMNSTTKDLQDELTQSFELHIKLKTPADKDLTNDVKNAISSHTTPTTITLQYDGLLAMIPYSDSNGKYLNHSELFRSLESFQNDDKILNFKVTSKTLDDLFQSVENEGVNFKEKAHSVHNNNNNNITEAIDLMKSNNNSQNHNPHHTENDENNTLWETLSYLLWKRLLHFHRNYRLIICMLVLPVIFEIIAMGFLKIRPAGDFDNEIEFDRSMYPNSFEFYSKENVDQFGLTVNDDFEGTCSLSQNCQYFDSSKDTFNWILDTHEEYIGKRYGGISINDSRYIVWYNNKGYHSMPLYMNLLNSAVFRAEMNDSSYVIKTQNHPLKLGDGALSVSSILQQVADSGISLILLISFSLVISGASVYIVNERMSGEKLQQKLAGVDSKVYWAAACIWDSGIYCVAVALAVVVFKTFHIPIYVEYENLLGIVVLLLLFGFAMIPSVHLFEKIFHDSSFANMCFFCVNIIIALTTLATILMFDVLAETDEHERIRNILNRLFLIFPQHALADGLIEICKNHITTKIFLRYYINVYKSPITSDLLRPHFTVLIIQGIVFFILNCIIESGVIWRIFNTQSKEPEDELKVITIQNTLTKGKNISSRAKYALKVDNLYKTFTGENYAVNNVSFTVNVGECYGLLGSNGAGKSSIFSIISGDTKRFSGAIEFLQNDKVSYCPQNNALDNLLTVEEIIQFYGKLRNIKNLQHLTENILDNFHLRPYKNVLVKNLSGGNRRKLSVACAAFGHQKLVLMDEPTSDMDPLTRNIVYNTIHKLNEENCSVLLTSHSISEIERICDSIGILVDGSMCARGTPEGLREVFGNRYVVTLLSEAALDSHFETDLRKTFRTMTNLMCHHYSSQFVLQVRDMRNVDHCHMKFSELIDMLNDFSTMKNLKYTITACKLDQVYDTIIKAELTSSYENNGFISNEY